MELPLVISKLHGILQRCTAIYRVIKNKIIKVVQQVFLSPVMDQLTVFRQVTALEILQNIFRSYGGY